MFALLIAPIYVSKNKTHNNTKINPYKLGVVSNNGDPDQMPRLIKGLQSACQILEKKYLKLGMGS